jgi:hypothetical protein
LRRLMSTCSITHCATPVASLASKSTPAGGARSGQVGVVSERWTDVEKSVQAHLFGFFFPSSGKLPYRWVVRGALPRTVRTLRHAVTSGRCETISRVNEFCRSACFIQRACAPSCRVGFL